MFEHITQAARNSLTDRIVGAITPARVSVLQRVDGAVAEVLAAREPGCLYGWELTPLLVASSGGRNGYIVALRATPLRGAHPPFPWEILQAIAARILEDAVHVRAVVPDIQTAAPSLGELDGESDQSIGPALSA